MIITNRKEENQKIIDKLQNQYAIIKEDIASNNKEILIKEKQQLLETVNSISEEVLSVNFSLTSLAIRIINNTKYFLRTRN